MSEIPRHLLDGLSTDDRKKVAAWWSGLTEEARSQVADLCDLRREECFFGFSSDAPVVIGGRFVSSDDTGGWEEWNAELFDYLVCNPELVFFAPPVVRTFHICTRHKAARSVLADGRIPSDFQCPFSSEECPIRRLLSVATNQTLQSDRVSLRLFGVHRSSSAPA